MTYTRTYLGGALSFFHDVLGPSDIGSQSKVEIRMTGWILYFKVCCVVKPTNQCMLPKAYHGALVLAVKGW